MILLLWLAFSYIYIGIGVAWGFRLLKNWNGTSDAQSQFEFSVSSITMRSLRAAPLPTYNVELISSYAFDEREEGVDLEEEHFHDLCAICLGKLCDGDMCKQMPCQHAFHADELDEWLRRNPSCPVCRKRVDLEA